MQEIINATAAITVAVVHRYEIQVGHIQDIIALVSDALHNAVESGRKRHLAPTGTESEVAQEPEASLDKDDLVQPDRVTCAICGFQGKVLRTHLKKMHGLSPDKYRARYKLEEDFPLVAPLYTITRSRLAKESGLGRAVEAKPFAGRRR